MERTFCVVSWLETDVIRKFSFTMAIHIKTSISKGLGLNCVTNGKHTFKSCAKITVQFFI